MSKKFSTVDQILSSLEIADSGKSIIYKHLAAILHLGEIQFEQFETDSREFGAQIIKSTENHVHIASELLNIEPDELKQAIQFRTIRVAGSYIT